MIIIKRVERIKLNNAEDDSNDTTTTQVEVEDKDGYYMQDKDDDTYNKNDTRRKMTTPIQYSTRT